MNYRTATRTRQDIITVTDVETGELRVTLGCVSEYRPADMEPAEAAIDVVRWFHGLQADQPVGTKILYTGGCNSTTYTVTFTETVYSL